MADLPQTLEECLEQVPASLDEMLSSKKNLEQISQYCKNSFNEDNKEVFDQTRQYTNDAILNVAYHVQRGTISLLHLLNMQTEELDALEGELELLASVRKAFLHQVAS